MTTTDALLEAARSILDDDGYIVIGKDGGIALVGFPEKLQQEDRVWMPGPDTKKALALALEAAQKQEAADANG